MLVRKLNKFTVENRKRMSCRGYPGLRALLKIRRRDSRRTASRQNSAGLDGLADSGLRVCARLLSIRCTEIGSFITDSEYKVDDDCDVEQEHDDLRCRRMMVNLENL